MGTTIYKAKEDRGQGTYSFQRRDNDEIEYKFHKYKENAIARGMQIFA